MIGAVCAESGSSHGRLCDPEGVPHLGMGNSESAETVGSGLEIHGCANSVDRVSLCEYHRHARHKARRRINLGRYVPDASQVATRGPHLSIALPAVLGQGSGGITP